MTVSDTVAVAAAPAASVTLYWKESVVSVPSSGAVATTVAPLAAKATAPADGAVSNAAATAHPDTANLVTD